MTRSELILGGQKSGKSRRAELLARQWLQESPAHRALLIATGQALDAEMGARIARHQRERAERVPGLQTLEEPRDLAQALRRHAHERTLVVVDCLTLWLTNWLLPVAGVFPKIEQKVMETKDWSAQEAMFFEALAQAPGPVVLVGNEIGLGVVPLGRELRAFVDALGRLNQDAAAACARVTLMCAGLALTLKEQTECSRRP